MALPDALGGKRERSMNLIFTRDEAKALYSVLARAIRDKTADARLNGWKDEQLPALRSAFLTLNDALAERAEP